MVAYHDRALSGASRLRPGYQNLLSGARRGDFDVVVSEALDRLSRDQEDIAHLYKLLSFAGVKLVTLAEGEITELHVGLKGTMNALFLKDLAGKTRRGLRGRVEAGRSGGGNSYGYTVVHSTSGDELPEAGGRCIDHAEADVVRRIFHAYSSGISPRRIAKILNSEKIPGPSGHAWGPSTINGNRDRGTGILNNELYIGRLVWNRLTYRKDPVMGKRRSRLNPTEQWVIKDVPDLRILPQSLWEAVKDRQQSMTRDTRPEKERQAFWALQRPRYLLSGLMKCGLCGASFTKYGSNRFACAGARDRATCSNNLTIHGKELEVAILAGLKERLMQPTLFKEFADEFVAEMNRQRSVRVAGRDCEELSVEQRAIAQRHVRRALGE